MKKAVNFTLYFLIAATIIMRIPTFLHNTEREKTKIPLISLIKNKDDQVNFYFPNQSQKYVLLFWSVNCLPCIVELDRLNRAVKNNELKPDQIIPINLDGDYELYKKFLLKKRYGLNLYFDKSNELSQFLKIQVTPTIVFLDSTKTIVKMNSGIQWNLVSGIDQFLRH